MSNKNKDEKPLEVNMEFDEMMQRLTKVDKTEVQTSIKKIKNKDAKK